MYQRITGTTAMKGRIRAIDNSGEVAIAATTVTTMVVVRTTIEEIP